MVINSKMFNATRVIFLGHLSILIPSFINTVSIDMPAQVSTAITDILLNNLKETTFKGRMIIIMSIEYLIAETLDHIVTVIFYI